MAQASGVPGVLPTAVCNTLKLLINPGGYLSNVRINDVRHHAYISAVCGTTCVYYMLRGYVHSDMSFNISEYR